MSSNNETAGIQTGRVYETATPGFAQSATGQSVYNDRLVMGLKQTGSGLLGYEVTYLDASDNTVQIPATLFIEQAGADVTDLMPPTDKGAGILNKGFNWRAWSGPAAAFKTPEPVVFAPGAGQMQVATNVVADSMPEGLQAPKTEGSEKPDVVVTQAAPAPAAPAAPGLPAANDANDNPTTGNFANSDSDTPAPAGTPAPAPAPAPAAAPEAPAHPITRSPSRVAKTAAPKDPAAPKATRKSPAQKTEQAAGVDAGTTTATARAN